MGCEASQSGTGFSVTKWEKESGSGENISQSALWVSWESPSRLLVDQLAYSCFSHLMKRMGQNFPSGGAMDSHFANMRSLIQVSGGWAWLGVPIGHGEARGWARSVLIWKLFISHIYLPRGWS